MNKNNKFDQKSSTSWYPLGDLACTVLAVVLVLVVGWLDLQVTEVAVTILALLAAGLLLGLLQPVSAWRWALLIAIGLPIMATVAGTIGLPTAESVGPDLGITLLAFAFALLGLYVGVFIRHTVRTLTGRST